MSVVTTTCTVCVSLSLLAAPQQGSAEPQPATSAAGVEQLHDITDIERTPVPEATQTPFWPWLVGSTALIAGGVVFLWRRAKPATAPSPAERALAAVDLLENSSPDDEACVRFQAELAEVLRRYLQERFELPSWQQTTPELVKAIEKCSLVAAEPMGVLQELLQAGDRSKFAPALADAESCLRLAALARRFIQETSPLTDERAASAESAQAPEGRQSEVG